MTPEQYNESTQAGVVLVDFHSDNCGPCRMLNPILEELENVNVVKVNVGDSPEVSADHGVHAVPTLKFYKEGVLKDSWMGLQSKDKLQTKIDELNAD